MSKEKVFLPLLLLGLSQSPVLAQSGPAPNQAPTPGATLHFYQDKAYGLFYPKYRVYANGKLVCKLGRNSYCQVTVPAGSTVFTARIPLLSLGMMPPLTLPLEAGKNYYLQGGVAVAGKIPTGVYGFTEVVPNETKLAQLAQARLVQPVAEAAE